MTNTTLKDLLTKGHQIFNLIKLRLGLVPDVTIQSVSDTLLITLNKNTGEVIEYTVLYDNEGLWKSEVSTILKELKRD